VSVSRPRGGPAFRAHLAVPEGSSEPGPGVVVVHEVYGLTDDIRRITQRFATSGYAAIAPDLYDRPRARALCIAETMLTMRRGRGPAFDDIDAARAHLSREPGVDGSRLAVAGFCMGGGFAIVTAVRGPYRVSAPYYGEVPKHAADLSGLCPVVAGYGGKDRLFGPQGARLERHLEALGVPHDVKIYPDAGHSYMSQNPPTLLVRLGAAGPMKAGYDEAAAEDSWARMLAFFERHLRGDPEHFASRVRGR